MNDTKRLELRYNIILEIARLSDNITIEDAISLYNYMAEKLGAENEYTIRDQRGYNSCNRFI